MANTKAQRKAAREARARMAREFVLRERLNDHFQPVGGFAVHKHCNKPRAAWSVLGFELETQPTANGRYRCMLQSMGNPYKRGIFPCGDGSLGLEGIEWKSDAGTLPWLFALVDELYTRMDEWGYTAQYSARYSCGLHVHIGNETFGVTSYARNNFVGKAARVIARFPEFFNAMAARDIEACGWCDSYRIGYVTPSSERGDRCPVRAMHDDINAEFEGVKYAAVNICHDDTVELRIGAGRPTATQVKNYLMNVQAFVNLCKAPNRSNEFFEHCTVDEFVEAFNEYAQETQNMLADLGLL